MPETSRFQDLIELARRADFGEISEREFEAFRTELYPERYGSSSDPAVGSTEINELNRRWYQRSRFWLIIAVTTGPLGFLLVIISSLPFLEGDSGTLTALVRLAVWLAGVLLMPFLFLGVAYAAFVGKRIWSQILLGISAVFVLLLVSWAVWSYLDNVETNILEDCISEAAEICESNLESFATTQILAWVYFISLWMLPIVFGFWLRRSLRFAEADLMNVRTHNRHYVWPS